MKQIYNEAEVLLMTPMKRMIAKEEWNQIKAYMLSRINTKENIVYDN